MRLPFQDKSCARAFRASDFVIPSSFVILFRHRQTDEPIECLTNRVWYKNIEEQLHVKHNDNAVGRPAQNLHSETARKLAHFRLFPRKSPHSPNARTVLHSQFDLTCI